MHHRPVSTGECGGKAPPRPRPGAPTGANRFLSRAELGSHLQLSIRSVDRFIARHRLKSGPGRAVLVREESYAWCLVTLRRQSTRSTAPAPDVRRDARAPCPIQPGEELLEVARSDGAGPLVEALEMYSGCRTRTLDECPAGHWGWAWHHAAQTMVNVLKAIPRGSSRPKPTGDSPASRYLRQLLRDAQVNAGHTLDAAVLTRCLRRMRAGERRLLLEALSGEVADSVRAGSDAPLAYAREPLLTEEELASEVRRTVATVRRWRVEGAGPVFLSIGRAVRYSRVDVDRWLGERRFR